MKNTEVNIVLGKNKFCKVAKKTYWGGISRNYEEKIWRQWVPNTTAVLLWGSEKGGSISRGLYDLERCSVFREEL